MNQTTNVQEVKSVLRDLEEALPHEGKSVYLFAQYVADRLPDRPISASGFDSTCQIVLQDLHQKVDRRPIPLDAGGGTIPLQYHGIAGRDQIFYDGLGRRIVDIAATVLPQEMATQVSAAYQKANDAIAEGTLLPPHLRY